MSGITLFLLQQATNILPPNFWQQNIWLILFGIVAVIAIYLNWATANKKLPKILAGKFMKDDPTTQNLPEPLGIPYGFDYRNYIHDFINAEKLKEGSTYGSVVYRVHYYGKDGEETFKDCPEDRLEVEITDSLLSGDEVLIRYIDDENMDRKDTRIAILKDQLEEAKGRILSYKEQTEESRFSDSYKKSRSKQRQGAVHSSRTFGGSGTRYPRSDDMSDEYDDEDMGDD